MKQSLDTRTKLLTQRPFSLMLELSIPAVLGMVVVGLYNMMDSIFVGQMVGSVQMGAVSVSYPFTLINAGSAAMLGVGSASVLSRAIGKKDENTVKKIMGNLVAAVVILSVIYTVIGMVFTRQLLSLAGASDNILNYAEKYLRIIFAGSLFVNFFQSANMVIRGEGQLKKAMFIIASGAILNIILDPIFIALLNPYGMGIEGAAYATVLSQFVQAVITVWYFKKKSPNVKIGRIRIDGPILRQVLAVGVSALLMQVCGSQLWRGNIPNPFGRGSALLELLICSSVGDQSGLPARRRYELRGERLRPCKAADKSIYRSRHHPVPVVLDTCRATPGKGAFHVHYNAGCCSVGRDKLPHHVQYLCFAG